MREASPYSPETAIAIIERVGGAKAGYRRAHARGLVLRGVFTATPEAKRLSIAEHMQGAAIPCLVRLSNASSNPCSPDRTDPKSGRVLGLAIRFDLPSGAKPTWAGINIPLFPARIPDEFLDLTLAQAPGQRGKPNMLRLMLHIVKHLHILASVKSIKALKPSGSFALESYHGIHAYYLIDAAGKRQAFRYHWVAQPSAAIPSGDEIKGRPDQYLLQEIRARLRTGPVSWDLVAELAEPGDPVDDASVAWPAGRKRIMLGVLTVDHAHEDQSGVELLVFDPANVVPGIGLSEDPVLKFRSLVYGVSYDRRSREKRAEPAPADMGQ
ncbi:MAG: catalase family peroxidase [Fibrobacteria bacterium]